MTPDTHSPIRIGAIGAGSRLRGLMRRFASQGDGPAATLTRISDPSEHAITECRKLFGNDVAAVADWRELVAAEDVDWVWIGSWNCHHAEQAIAAMEAGKNVFCEKPLATTPEDCLAVRDAVERTGRTFALGLVLRYSPFYRKVHEIVASGRLGELISFEFNETLDINHGGYIFGNWRRKRANAGTHLLEKCCHDIDIVHWLTGRLPVRAASFGGKRYFTPENRSLADALGTDAQGNRAYERWTDPARRDPFDGEADIVDHQVAILEYANGLRGSFHTNCNSGIPERRVYLNGTRGALRADAISGKIEFREIGFDTEIERHDDGLKGGGHAGGDQVLVDDMIRTMRDGAPPRAGIEEGVKSAFTAFGIDAAHDTGTVYDLGELWKRAGIEP